MDSISTTAAYVDQHADCQEALDIAFHAQSTGDEELIRAGYRRVVGETLNNLQLTAASQREAEATLARAEAALAEAEQKMHAATLAAEASALRAERAAALAEEAFGVWPEAALRETHRVALQAHEDADRADVARMDCLTAEGHAEDILGAVRWSFGDAVLSHVAAAVIGGAVTLVGWAVLAG